MGVFNLYKSFGLTPLEALEKLRFKLAKEIKFTRSSPPVAVIMRREKMTYAGRLDPLATGVMIILSGEDIKRKKEFLSLSKTYEIEVLFGISTDTGDVLGLIKDIDPRKIKAIDIRKEVANLIGPRRQTAPPFSSPGLDGKLFEKEIEIYSTRLGIIAEIRADDLLSGVETSINQVAGNFRQTPILACWRKLLNNRSNNFQTVNLIVNCSSGTYMRLLAEELGKALGLPALAYKIKRLRVGEYLIDDSLVL